MKYQGEKTNSANKKTFHVLRSMFYDKQGFTIIELLVVLAIFAVLSGTLFINYGRFNVGASLDNLVHQIALIVRQAQVYGISVSQSSTQQFRGYGAYFSVATINDQKTFIMFSDKAPADKLYTPAIPPGQQDNCDGLSECVERITIQSGDKVEKIIANEKTSFPGTPAKEVHIVFTRPNPDANIVAYKLSDGTLITTPISDVVIYLQSLRGDEKKVVVWSTGQIAVE